MKKAGVIIGAVLLVILVVGGFYFVTQKANKSSVEDQTLTEVQSIITKNLEEDYPLTPRQVVSLYNRIITAYYKEDYSSEEFDQLVDQELLLFDDELLEINPKATYKASLAQDIAEYEDANKTIEQWSVCDSDDVQYTKDQETGDNIAFVDVSYFMKEGKSTYTRTYEKFVLRKDADGNWKILGFYQTDGSSEDD